MKIGFHNLNRGDIRQCCMTSEVALWHWKHGWLYNVSSDGRMIGICYITLLCGSGGVIHFDACGKVTAAELLGAFRKGVQMFSGVLGIFLATIPPGKERLISCAKRLGFEEINRDGKYVILRWRGKRGMRDER